ncbi:transthyretin-like family domain-containing protein [Ditylenchus destructor]|nr:transthyretin-like family domain-containing protein [Ditylenchus destructor]
MYSTVLFMSVAIGALGYAAGDTAVSVRAKVTVTCVGTPVNLQKVELWEHDVEGSTDYLIKADRTDGNGYVELEGFSQGLGPYLYLTHSCNVPSGCDYCVYHGEPLESVSYPGPIEQVFKASLELNKYKCGCLRT